MSSQADASAGVRRARERFLSVGWPSEDTLRTDVLDSWRRSRALGVHPDRMNLPFVQEPNADSPLTTAAAPVLDRITDDLSAQAVSLILTSSDGLVLQRLASDPSMMNALDMVQLAPGYSYGEEFVGTTGADIGPAGLVRRINTAGRRPHVPRPAHAVISIVDRIADPHQHAG